MLSLLAASSSFSGPQMSRRDMAKGVGAAASVIFSAPAFAATPAEQAAEKARKAAELAELLGNLEKSSALTDAEKSLRRGGGGFYNPNGINPYGVNERKSTDANPYRPGMKDANDVEAKKKFLERYGY